MAYPDEIKRRFTFHPPTDETRPKHEAVNALMLETALRLDEILPDGREKTLALTHLQDVRAWANTAIATALTPSEIAVEHYKRTLKTLLRRRAEEASVLGGLSEAEETQFAVEMDDLWSKIAPDDRRVLEQWIEAEKRSAAS